MGSILKIMAPVVWSNYLCAKIELKYLFEKSISL